MSVQQIFYVSRAVTGYTDLPQILATSRHHNSRSSLTGSLLFTGQYFAQVLEGAPDKIDSLMEVILLDKRHTAVKVVLREQIPAPQFAAWSMAYCELPGAEDLLGHLLEGRAVDPNRARRVIDLMFGEASLPDTLNSLPAAP